MTYPYKIAVAGGGIGGMAVAAFLARQGHAVSLFDQFSEPSPVGSGLVVQPIGQMVLTALGALDHAMMLGARMDRMQGIEADSGKTVLDVRYSHTDDTRFGLAMHRASLFDTVFLAASKAGAAITANATITDSKLYDTGRLLILNNRETVGPFDLVIDACGATSPLSQMSTTQLPFGALWGVLDNAPEPFGGNVLAQAYRKSSVMAGLLPIGRLPGGAVRKTAFFWSMPHEKLDHWPQTSLQKWKEEVVKVWPATAPVLEQFTDHENLTSARYSHGTLRNPVGERLVFIGDAAHRTSPQLGQGANMALFDALVLAECLSGTDIETALQNYTRMRRWHVRIYQLISYVFTPFYQSNSAILPILRDRILSPISGWPILNRILSKMVCGDLVYPGATLETLRHVGPRKSRSPL